MVLVTKCILIGPLSSNHCLYYQYFCSSNVTFQHSVHLVELNLVPLQFIVASNLIDISIVVEVTNSPVLKLDIPP